MNQQAQARPALILIHAFPMQSAMWEPQRAALGGMFDIHAIDLPGFGNEPRLDGEAFSMPLAARFIEEELNARKIERCVIGGLSMGGYVAFECWRLFPARIAGLILADTRATADTPEGRQARFTAAERIGGGAYERYVDEMMEILLCETTRRERPEITRTARAIALSVIPETAIDGLLGMASRADSTPLLPTISVPTAVIVGAGDTVTPPAEATRMAAAIPNATLTIIPDAAHLSNLENPQAFNRAATELMRKSYEL